MVFQVNTSITMTHGLDKTSMSCNYTKYNRRAQPLNSDGLKQNCLLIGSEFWSLLMQQYIESKEAATIKLFDCA